MFDVSIFAPLFAQMEEAQASSGELGQAFVGVAVAVGLFTMIILVVAVPTIVHHRYLKRVAELNADIKQQMIQRGYSVEEILAVINEDPKVLNRGKHPPAKMTPSKIPPEPLRN